MEDDKRIIEKVLNGKINAFRILIDRYERLVAHIVFRMVPNSTEQEEIAQEVFIKVYQHLATFKFNSRLSTWIGRIAFNTCMNHLRKEKVPLFEDLLVSAGDNRDTWKELDHSEALRENHPDPSMQVEREERQKQIQDGIAALPAPYRLIITLFHLDELSYVEIAEITGWPEGTIKSHLFRGRKLLKEKLITEYTGEEIWN